MDQYEDIDIFQIDEALPPTREGARPDLEGNIGGQALAQGLSNVYDFLAPSDEALAALQEQQRINKEIADRAGISEKELYRMSAYGADTENILGDLGFKRYSLGDDLTRVRDFLFGSQKKGFNKLAEGTDFLDLTGEEMFGVALAPLDVLDYAGLGTALTKLATKGMAKYGGKSTLLDAAKDKQLVGTLSQSEIMEVMQKLKPVVDGEQEALLRFAKGKPTKKKVSGTLTSKQEAFPDGIPLTDFDESLLQQPSTELNYIGSKQKGGPRSKFSPEADMFLLNNPSLSGGKILEELNSNLNKYGLTDKINTDALKYRKSQLNIPPADRSKTPPKVQEQKEKLFQEFELSLENIDLENAGSVFEAFENAAKNNMGYLQSFKTAEKALKEGNVPRTDNRIRSMNTKIKEFIKDYNSLPNKKIEVKNLKELKQSQPKSSSGKSKLQQLQFNEFLVKTPEYKKILETYPAGDDKYIKRYLNFVRDSSLPKDRYPKLGVKSQIVEGDNLANFDNFYNEYNVELNDLSNLESTFAKDFKEFKRVDQIRERVSSLLQPYFKVAFPEKSNSVQIAHRFKGSEVGNSVPAGVAGSGGAPYSYDLDISIVNAVIQERLEKQAKKALRSNNLTEIKKISNDAARVGTQFEIDGYKFGQAQPLRDVLESLVADAMIDGPQKGFTDDVIEGMNEAITILDTEIGSRKQLNKGGMVKNFAYGGDVTEDLDIFEAPEDSLPEGSYQTANLILPFFKLFGKAPPHTTAPIPTPKEKLVNPTKKQKESLESETIKRSTEDIFDPTPNDRINIEESITTTPITKQPMTSVFYSDVDRLLSRPDTPKTFNSKQEFFDFLNKNNIRKSESMDYRIPQILKLFGDTDPIDTATILTQVRTAPISGMRVHATGPGSELINPNGAVSVRYSGYAEDGFIEGSQRERILYMNRDKLPGDSGDYPQSMFGGEQVNRHEFQIPNEQDTYIVGWTRLTDRFGFVPPKVAGPETQINIRQTTKELNKNKRSLQGLYAEARSKLARLANQRGMSQRDINDIDIDFGSDTPKLSVIAKYADQLDEVSPGLVNQMDELVVKNNELQEQINKASGIDPSGVVRVTYADEIQSDILQAAAMRKQQLAAALRKIQEEGKESTNLQGLNRVAEATLNFFEENKSVFRPLEKSPEEMKLLNQQMIKLDEEVDELVNKYIATRELDDAELAKLGTLLNDNIDKMLNEVMTIDGATMSGLFPDLPLKNREEWADALIKKDLYELAYRKFVLKDPNASDYYATATSKPVINRYGFEGNAATSKELRDIDKQQRFDTFKSTGEFKSSKYKGIGMDEFYGGPNTVDEKGKHYTSTIEKILKKQAKENNSEVITMPVQVKKGSKAQYQVTDQNGNMVATLTNEDQARELMRTNPNYQIKPISIPDKKSMEPVFAIKITEEMLESFATHKAKGGLVSNIDIFEVA